MEKCEVCLQNRIEKAILLAIKSHFSVTPVYNIFSEEAKKGLLNYILAGLDNYGFVVKEKVPGGKK